MPPTARARGYSLMEVLSVVSVLAVVASIALPSVSSFHASQTASAAAKIFLADVRLARYEAIRTGLPHRLILSDIASANTYRVQMLDLAIEDGITTTQFGDPDNWFGVLDAEAREIDPRVTITASRNTALFFTPDGLVAEVWVWGMSGTPLVPRLVHFAYGNATATVTLNGAGGLSSREFYAAE